MNSKPTCDVSRESFSLPEHTHSCDGGHEVKGGHFCRECGRWWWE